MALSLVLLAACLSVLQLGSGQPTPTPPVLSESFTATMTRVGAGQEMTYTLYRNYEEGMQRQTEKLGAGKKVDGTINIILISTDKKEYQYFEPYGYCASIAAPGIRLIPQWAFVKEAKYKGERTFNGSKVEVWAYNDTKVNVYYEIGVSIEVPKVPVFLFQDEGGIGFAIITFDTYTNGPPEASKFEVPELCKEKPSWFHRDTVARNYSHIGAFDKLVR